MAINPHGGKPAWWLITNQLTTLEWCGGAGPVSQSVPVYRAKHVHWYAFAVKSSQQVPPFWHGL